MVKLLSKLFIKNPTEYTDPSVRKAYGTLCSLLGIFLNALLFAGKYAVGAISGSIAITADAFNNLSDAGSSFITLAGFLYAGKTPARRRYRCWASGFRAKSPIPTTRSATAG